MSAVKVLDERTGVGWYDHRVVLRLATYASRHVARIVLALLAVLLFSGTVVAVPWIIRLIVDRYLPIGDALSIDVAAALFLGVATLQLSASYWHRRLDAYIGQRILFDLRTELFAHLQLLSPAFFDRNEAGKIMSRLQNDVRTLERFVSVFVVSIADLLSVIGVIVAMFSMSARLAGITLVVIPVLLATITVWQRVSRRPRMQMHSAVAAVNSHLQETISGIRVVQSLRREEQNLARFRATANESMSAMQRINRFDAALMPATMAVGSLALGLIVLFGGLMVFDGVIGAGVLIAFSIYVERLFSPLRNLSGSYDSLHGSMAAGARVFELLDVKPEVADSASVPPMPPITGQVEFQNVGFHYTAGVPVLEDVSLQVPAGHTVAIVGPTGAGKTTLVSLLLRMYDVSSGRVLIDGRDVREVQRDTLVQQMSIVMQEPLLFAGTVAENIRFRGTDISDEDVVQAATLVGADAFIQKLPEGYETVLTERGANLSLGQRQLLSFARAVAADPRILVLDEATAYVDTYTEMLIQRAMRELLAERTSLVIAHRLSTVTQADLIVVMESGRIVERGTHEALAQGNGLYARLLAYSGTSNTG